MSNTLVAIIAVVLGIGCLGSFATGMIICERIQTYKQGNKVLVWTFSAMSIINFVGLILLYKYWL